MISRNLGGWGRKNEDEHGLTGTGQTEDEILVHHEK